jgi:hypothetical protein
MEGFILPFSNLLMDGASLSTARTDQLVTFSWLLSALQFAFLIVLNIYCYPYLIKVPTQ